MHPSSISQKSYLADPTNYIFSESASFGGDPEHVRFTGSGKWLARPGNIWKTPFWKQFVSWTRSQYFRHLLLLAVYMQNYFTICHVGLIPIQLFGPIQAANKSCSSAKRPVKRGAWRSASAISSTYELLSKNQLTEFVFYCLFHFARLGATAHAPLENNNL